jgi:hypothetical protein
MGLTVSLKIEQNRKKMFMELSENTINFAAIDDYGIQF